MENGESGMTKLASLLPGRNISVRLALYLFLMNGTILIVSSAIGYPFIGNIIKENTAYYAEHYIRSMNNEINFYIQDIDFMTLSLFFLDRNLFGLLNDDVRRIELQSYFDGFKNSRDYIDDIFLVNKHLQVGGTSSAYRDKLIRSDIYRSIMRSEGELVVSPIGPAGFVMNTDKAKEQVLFLGRRIKSPQTNETEGVVIVTVPANRIAQIIAKEEKRYDETILLIDRNAHIIYNPNPADRDAAKRLANMLPLSPGASYRSQDGYLYITGKSDGPSTMEIVGFIPEKALLKDAAAIRNIQIALNLGMLLIAMTMALLIAYRFLKPIIQLAYYMRQIGNREWLPYRAKTTDDEIGFLIRCFNEMIDRLQDSFERLAAEQEKKKQAEMRALQAQINPHFIFNTLNTIRWLAKMGRGEQVFEMITSMNEILVGAFQLNQPIITIGEEIGYLKRYIHIQQMVHPDKIEVVYELDEAILNKRIARLCLQPLVENTILHGILPKSGPGTIRITGRAEEGHVIIAIADDGVGSPPLPPSSGKGERERVGLYNVDKRLKLYFGEAYGVRLSSAEGKGTTVTVALPE